jgi:hypothetical protein
MEDLPHQMREHPLLDTHQQNRPLQAPAHVLPAPPRAHVGPTQFPQAGRARLGVTPLTSTADASAAAVNQKRILVMLATPCVGRDLYR